MFYLLSRETASAFSGIIFDISGPVRKKRPTVSMNDRKYRVMHERSRQVETAVLLLLLDDFQNRNTA